MRILLWDDHLCAPDGAHEIDLADFILDNIDMEPAERTLAVHAVEQGCPYYGGGGAAAKWCIAPLESGTAKRGG